jgi:hypothetical protein
METQTSIADIKDKANKILTEEYITNNELIKNNEIIEELKKKHFKLMELFSEILTNLTEKPIVH